MSSSKRKQKSTSFDLISTSPVFVRKGKKHNYGTLYSGKKATAIKENKRSKEKKPGKTIKKPFVPPPGKTSPGRPFSWESKSHRLEINPPLSSTRSRTMHVDELSSTEDEDIIDPSHKFESKITELLNDVSLGEREYLKTKTTEQLNASRKLIEEQENEIETYRNDLNNSIRDYSKLKKSFDLKEKEVEFSRNEAEQLGNDKESLMSKLLEVENEGRAASRELDKLRDTCRRLKKDQQFSDQDINTLTMQRDMLLEKLDQFEATNGNLRSLLREAQRKQASDEHLSDRCDILMKKLTTAEAQLQNQCIQVSNQENQIEKMIGQIKEDKRQLKLYEEMHVTMETTREHLQNQLRQKESECERLANIITKLEKDHDFQKDEKDRAQGLLMATRDKSMRDKEALKKATRIQRERAQKREEDNEGLQRQVNTLLLELDQAKTTLHDLTEVHTRVKQDKEFLEDESTSLRKSIIEMGETLELSTKSMKSGPIYIADKLVSKVRTLKSVKLQNANLRDELKTLEDNMHSNDKENSFKLRASESELSKLRAALEQFETLTGDYKSQLERSRYECNDLQLRLRQQEDEMNRQLKQSMEEVNDVRSALESKILELEPYPELLKTSEVRLQETQERAIIAEKRLAEHNHIVADLTQKIELQTEQLDQLRDKYRSKYDECKHLDQQLQALDRQVQSADGSQRELIQSLGRKDENLALLQERFDAQRIENERLIKQLETALSDVRKQVDSQKEKALTKERTAHARITDLEAQLLRSTQNTQLLKRSKEEAERKFNSRLQDMRDRLEQANTTTRSMQNYVHFLKSTYANVFTDDIES